MRSREGGRQEGRRGQNNHPFEWHGTIKACRGHVRLSTGARIAPNILIWIGIQLCRRSSQKQICSRSVVNFRVKVNKF